MEKKTAKKKLSTKKSAKSKSKVTTKDDQQVEGDTSCSNNNNNNNTQSVHISNGVGGGAGGGRRGVKGGEGEVAGNTKRPQSSMSMSGKRKVTEEERKEIAEAFRMLDEDGDGKLGFDEMKKLLQSQFMSFTDTAAADVIQQLDEDGSGEIEFKEFEKYVIENNLCKPTLEEFSSEMKAAFEMFDSDNNGYIDASEFRALMGAVGDKMTEDDITEMMKEADTNGDGFIDYREFCMHMSKAF